MNLSQIRQKIDACDTEIFAKISERLKLVEGVVQWKEQNGMQIFDPKREDEIVLAKRELAEQFGFSADTAEEILRAIIAESHLQEKRFLQNDETSPRKIRKKKIAEHPPLLEIFEHIAEKEKYFFFLESLGDDEWNQQSLLSFSPKKRFAAKGNQIFVDDVLQGEVENPILWLEEQFLPYQNLVANSKETGFCGGLVGSVAFEAVNFWEKTLQLPLHSDFYDFEFGLFLDCLVYDRKTEELHYIFADEDRSEKIKKILERENHFSSPPVEGCPVRGGVVESCQSLHQNSEKTTPPFRHPSTGGEFSEKNFSAKSLGSNFSDEELEKMIVECKEEILAGNVFQIVPSRKFFYEFEGSEIAFYKKLRETNPSPHMFFLHFDDRKMMGSSPEMVAKIMGKRIETYPIAGTRSRGKTPQEDAKLSAEMLSDDKEIAEHLMLVDMARNDLGRVCEFGSVKVEEIMALKKYNFVQHLVSRVVGKVKNGVSSLQAALTNFPMGTVSGSPRVEALKILKNLEKEPRGPYSGSVGYWSINGDLIFVLAIRSFFLKKNKGFAQAGAGIVFDSVPEFERKEIEKKSKNIRSLLEK